MSRRFVPQATIDRRVQAKDDRINAAVRARRERPAAAPSLADDPRAVFNLVDNCVAYACRRCQRMTVNTGDYPYCSYTCKCEDRTR